MHAVAIPVSDVAPVENPEPRLDLRVSIESLLRRRVEALDVSDDKLVVCKDTHPFAQAAHDAFYKHWPLTITPDDIWFCIAQGFAHHVNLNAETLRDRFVGHEGKLTLEVTHNGIVLGEPSPWHEAFAGFSDQIASHVGRELRDTVVADFSTTTHLHRAATEVALMDSFQAYFDYKLLCGCGIPTINLIGAPDDWRSIRSRAASLAQYGLEHWINELLPVLDEIEATSRGHGDREFWKSFFRHRSASLGSAMTGWIHVLFPYLKGRAEKLVPNQYLATWPVEYLKAIKSADATDRRQRNDFDGPYLGEIPSGVCSAPVEVVDVRDDSTHRMRFVAGMFGVSQDSSTLALSPSFGWAVAYDQVIPPTPKPGHQSEMDARRRH